MNRIQAVLASPILFAAFLLFQNSVNAQSIEWEKTCGDSITNQYCHSVIQCPDSGFVFLGRTMHPILNTSDIYILKTNRYGDTIWSQTYGYDYGEDIGEDIVNTSDGGFIICGTTTSIGAGSWDIYILKLDSLGDTIWTTTYGDIYTDMGKTIIETKDGNYCLTGHRQLAAHIPSVLFITKIDEWGNEIWTSTLGDRDTTATGYDLLQCSDSGFIVAGCIDTVGSGRLNSLIARYNKFGQYQWSNHFGDTSWVGSNRAYSLCQSLDGGFVFTGYEYTDISNMELLLMKVDINGDSVWSRLYSDTINLIGLSIDALINGGYIIAGTGYNQGINNDIYVLKTDSIGDTTWTEIIDRGPDDKGVRISQAFDGGFILGGDFRLSSEETKNILAIKYATSLPNISAFLIDNSNDFSHVINNIPEFNWSISSPYSGVHDSIRIDVGTDQDWSVAEMWSTGTFPTADTFITYSGNTLIDGEIYYIRLKVAENDLWSPWFETLFRMNSVPSVPVALYPLDDDVTINTPILWIGNSIDAEGDVITYDFSGFHDTDCVAPIIDLQDVAEGIYSTGGQIIDPLGENCIYWWSARAFDGYEYSDWSATQKFYIDGTPEPPTAFHVQYPPDTSGWYVFDMMSNFFWEKSYDPDPLDSVYYTLQVAVDSNFQFVSSIDSIWQEWFTLTDSLEFATQYWWKVKATDNTGRFTYSSNTLTFKTWKLGDANGDWQVNIFDITFIITYLYLDGPAPGQLIMGDVNGDCVINIFDITYLIGYLYIDGPAPVVGCE